MWLSLALGCAHLPPAAPHPPVSYDITAILASPGHVLTSTYRIEVAPRRGGTVAFRTTRSRVVIEEKDRTFTWDSESPDPREPWVVVQERAISGVAAPVVLGEDGRPIALLDEGAWRLDALAALAALGLPLESRASADALLDPAGVVAGLARDFPGAPPADGAWRRTESIGDREITRDERCVADGDRWTCEGTASGPGLEDGSSRTIIAWDRKGLVELDAGWDAIAVANAPGGSIGRKVVAGRRRVTRSAP